MGVLRSCHTAPARAYYGGPEVVIRWYFAAPDAPLYAKGHVWEPICYRKDRQVTDDSIGELPRRRQPWCNGANPGVRLEDEPCGTEADYRGEGVVPQLPNGRPDFAEFCGCAYRPCIGWEVVTHHRRSLLVGLVVEGQWEATKIQNVAGVGELAMEGQWSATKTQHVDGVGELAMEGQWSEIITGPPSGTGELAMEGQWSATKTQHVDGVGELAMEGQWSELGTGPVAGTGELAMEGEWSSPLTVEESEVGELAMEGEWSEEPDDWTGWRYSDHGGATHEEVAEDSIRFAALDSAECGGSSDERQWVVAKKRLTFFGATTVSVTLSGLTERQNSDFDAISMSVDGVEVWRRSSNGTEEGCAMEERSESFSFVVPEGTHVLKLLFDTVDGHYHVGAFWYVVLGF